MASPRHISDLLFLKFYDNLSFWELNISCNISFFTIIDLNHSCLLHTFDCGYFAHWILEVVRDEIDAAIADKIALLYVLQENLIVLWFETS